MHHELFGDLRYNPHDQLWTGWMILRQFAAFGEARYDGLYDDESERLRRHEGALPVEIWDPGGTGPPAQQEAAYRFLHENQADVFRAALGALFESFKAYTDAPSPLSPFWNWLGGLLGVKHIESPAGLHTEAAFTGVKIARECINGVAYILFDVDCYWEPEHGIMIVYHQKRPATWTTADALELESDANDEQIRRW
jgi:hypothetical protein